MRGMRARLALLLALLLVVSPMGMLAEDAPNAGTGLRVLADGEIILEIPESLARAILFLDAPHTAILAQGIDGKLFAAEGTLPANMLLGNWIANADLQEGYLDALVGGGFADMLLYPTATVATGTAGRTFTTALVDAGTHPGNSVVLGGGNISALEMQGNANRLTVIDSGSFGQALGTGEALVDSMKGAIDAVLRLKPEAGANLVAASVLDDRTFVPLLLDTSGFLGTVAGWGDGAKYEAIFASRTDKNRVARDESPLFMYLMMPPLFAQDSDTLNLRELTPDTLLQGAQAVIDAMPVDEDTKAHWKNELSTFDVSHRCGIVSDISTGEWAEALRAMHLFSRSVLNNALSAASAAVLKNERYPFDFRSESAAAHQNDRLLLSESFDLAQYSYDTLREALGIAMSKLDLLLQQGTGGEGADVTYGEGGRKAFPDELADYFFSSYLQVLYFQEVHMAQLHAALFVATGDPYTALIAMANAGCFVSTEEQLAAANASLADLRALSNQLSETGGALAFFTSPGGSSQSGTIGTAESGLASGGGSLSGGSSGRQPFACDIHEPITDEDTGWDHRKAPCGAPGHFMCIGLHEQLACGHFACAGDAHGLPAACGTPEHHTCDGKNHGIAACNEHNACDGDAHGQLTCGHFACTDGEHEPLACGHWACAGGEHGKMACGHWACAAGKHANGDCEDSTHYVCDGTGNHTSIGQCPGCGYDVIPCQGLAWTDGHAYHSGCL